MYSLCIYRFAAKVETMVFYNYFVSVEEQIPDVHDF